MSVDSFFASFEPKEMKDMFTDFVRLFVKPLYETYEQEFSEMNEDGNLIISAVEKKDYRKFEFSFTDEKEEQTEFTVCINLDDNKSVRLVTVNDSVDKSMVKIVESFLTTRCDICKKDVTTKNWVKHLTSTTHLKNVEKRSFVERTCDACKTKTIFKTTNAWSKHLLSITHKKNTGEYIKPVEVLFHCDVCNKDLQEKNRKNHELTKGHLDKLNKLNKRT